MISIEELEALATTSEETADRLAITGQDNRYHLGRADAFRYVAQEMGL